jgi:hypothetical protein
MAKRARIKILNASHFILCGHITYRDETGGGVHHITCSPHGDTVQTARSEEDLKHATIRRCRLEDVLPGGWSYPEFMTAWAFWVEGRDQGVRDEHQRHLRQKGKSES